MSNRRPYSIDIHSDSEYDKNEHRNNATSMNYLHRFLSRHSPSAPPAQRPTRSRSHTRPRTHHNISQPPNSPETSPHRHRSRSRSHHKHKQHRRDKMTSFNGPWSKDLDSFKKSVESMPDQYKASFSSASKSTLEKVCDPDVLHIWESDSDIDSLLQLTSIIAKLCDLGVRKTKGANANDGSMLIIAEENKSSNNFSRICQLVEYLTCAEGKRHLEGTVAVFSKIVIVRGWDNTIVTGQSEALEKTVKRVNIALERVSSMGNFTGAKKKIVWHHGPVLHFLLHWIHNTTSALRTSLSAITITGSLNLTTTISPSTPGRSNNLPSLSRLETYAKKLNIPVLFLDSPTQLITSPYLGTYMYFHAYYIHTFLPTPLTRPHLHKAQDDLVTFAFRLRAASEATYGTSAVKLVQAHLNPQYAKDWAKKCVNPANFEKKSCRSAAKDSSIHHAVHIADSPFSPFSEEEEEQGLRAFARLAIGPAACLSSTEEAYVAAPVDIQFSKAQFRPSFPSTFYILLPKDFSNGEKITYRIQGVMMAVLERIRQEKGNPVVGDGEIHMWNSLRAAVTWALDARFPDGVAGKVKFVGDKVGKGTWGLVVGGGGGAAAAAVSEPMRSYGFGSGMQQTRGMYNYPQAHLSEFVQGEEFAHQIPRQTLYMQGNGGRAAVLPSAMQSGYSSRRGQGGYGYTSIGQPGACPQTTSGPWV